MNDSTPPTDPTTARILALIEDAGLTPSPQSIRWATDQLEAETPARDMFDFLEDAGRDLRAASYVVNQEGA